MSVQIHLSVQTILTRYAAPVQETLRSLIEEQRARTCPPIEGLYGQISYHLGWVDRNFAPVQEHPGKLLRPTLLLLAYEAAGAAGLASQRDGLSHLVRALPAAAALELFHNFTLLHDDIEDGDVERRHRPTVWSLWGIPMAINTGNAIACMARLALFKLLGVGVDARLLADLECQFDRAAHLVIEGQHFDLSFETQEEVTLSMYLEMITKKTARLMECATEMGARIGTSDKKVIDGLRQFGLKLGIAFQIRDDILGIWGNRAQTGKTPSGDILRRKKTLPILHAFQHAETRDQAYLCAIYHAEKAPNAEQVGQVLEILDRTGSRDHAQHNLVAQCQMAKLAISQLPFSSHPLAQEARADLLTLVNYVQEDLCQAQTEQN